MLIHSFKGIYPEIGDDCFIAETAAIVGQVRMGDNCSVWYGAVLRGDVNTIEIGDRVNIQDCAVIHVSGGEGGNVVIGNDVVIGHNATVHGATVGSHCLIGMGATVLDGAVIGDGSLVAAHALVLGKTVIGPGELWAGVPAKFVKKISPAAVERTIDKGVQSYVELAEIYNEEYKE
ncbi:MAG: gamma carbonic anhydrase family protein [Bacteroidales bacterium]|nr:gamma carbonic anhydrase family protein [Candidatus Cryptobacteroides caccocaballi]